MKIAVLSGVTFLIWSGRYNVAYPVKVGSEVCKYCHHDRESHGESLLRLTDESMTFIPWVSFGLLSWRQWTCCCACVFGETCRRCPGKYHVGLWFIYTSVVLINSSLKHVCLVGWRGLCSPYRQVSVMLFTSAVNPEGRQQLPPCCCQNGLPTNGFSITGAAYDGCGGLLGPAQKLCDVFLLLTSPGVFSKCHPWQCC